MENYSFPIFIGLGFDSDDEKIKYYKMNGSRHCFNVVFFSFREYNFDLSLMFPDISLCFILLSNMKLY